MRSSSKVAKLLSSAATQHVLQPLPQLLVPCAGLTAAELWTAARQQPASILDSSWKSSRVTESLAASTSYRTFFGAPLAKKYNQRRLVGWTPEQLYQVISQVNEYKQFVPWCQKSNIIKSSDKYMEAELEVGFQMLAERYTSKVFLVPNHQVRSTVSNSTLFDHLDSTWTMEPGPTPKSCWLNFAVDFAFRSQLHGYLADMFFSEVVKQMTGAFEGRCAKQYGPSSLIKLPAGKAAPAYSSGQGPRR